MNAKPEMIAFTTTYDPEIGGAEVALRQVAERLSSEFDFLIVTARRSPANPPAEAVGEIRVRRLGIGRPMDKWLLPAMLPVLSRSVARNRTEGRKILLWGMDITQASLLAALVQRRHPLVPLVLTIQYGGSPERVARGRAGLIAPSLAFMLSRSARVTAVSSALVELARRYGSRTAPVLIPNGVEVDRFRPVRPGPADRRPTLVTISRLVRKNGIDTLLRALPPLMEDFPDLECRIIGDGEERRRLHGLAGRLGLERAVRFVGRVPHDEVPRYLWESDVFVRPSRSEGLGTGFLEAMAAGLPVIATPVGGVPDFVRDGENGLLTPVDDPARLAHNVRRLLGDRSLASKLGRRGMETVRTRFDADLVARQYADLFHKVLAEWPDAAS